MLHQKPTLQNFKCTICPLNFTEKQEFHSHVRGHFKSIKCEQCNKTLIGDKQYDYHLKHVHSGKKKIDERSKRTSKLDRPSKKDAPQAIQSLQIEDVEYGCGDSLESAISVTSNKPVENQSTSNVACDVCGRLFQNEDAVIRHRKTHSSEGKRFLCGFCGNGFNKKTNLEFHMRIHTKER